MTATPMFALEGATKRYGTLVALAPVSLSITSGERVALMGPSGSGKTTLLQLLSAALHPDAGDVRIAGEVTTSMRPGPALAQLVGVMPQGFDLVPSLAVVHNVLAGRLGAWGLGRALLSLMVPQDLAQARAALARVGIADKLYERTSRLSGGEQQRVALARLLVQRPRAILADEPVSSVDPARAEDLLAMLVEVAGEEGRTLVASMHAVPLALRYFSRVVALRAGHVAFDRPTEAVTAVDLAALYELEAAAERDVA
jgi:phosphonate transport system ATP-binding protein